MQGGLVLISQVIKKTSHACSLVFFSHFVKTGKMYYRDTSWSFILAGVYRMEMPMPGGEWMVSWLAQSEDRCR